MPKPQKPKENETPQAAPKKGKKIKYEPPKLEKFGTLEKLIVSGE